MLIMPTEVAMSQSTLACSYLEREDRLVLKVTYEGQGRAILLTRRITARLINAFAHVLARSSPLLTGQTPAEMRDEVIQLEHLQAIGPGPSKRKAVAPRVATMPKQRAQVLAPEDLVTGANVGVRPEGFVLLFHGDQRPLLQAQVNRPELHRILELLKRWAETAGWNVALETSWLQGDATDIVLN